MRLIRTQHAIHLVFGERCSDTTLPRERVIAPGLVELVALRALCKQADVINGRRQRPRTWLGSRLSRRRRLALA
jgi:hypothetical protein